MSRLIPIFMILASCPCVAMANEAYGPALFLPLERQRAIACTYRSKAWTIREAGKPTPDGTTPRFVRLHLGAQVQARVELPVNGAVPPRVKLERDGVVLNGGVESRDLLYPQRPVRISQVLHAHHGTRLRWLGGRRGRLQVGVPDMHRVYRAVNARSRVIVMCGAAGLEEGDPARFRKAHGVKRHAESHWVLLGDELAVTAAPGGGPRVFLPAALQDPYYDADSGRMMYFIKLDRERMKMKILTRAWSHHIVGWVNARVLRREGTEAAHTVDDPPGTAKPIPAGAVACSLNLRLYAQAGKKRARVGVVRRGTRILAHNGGGGGWLKITLPGAGWFEVEPGAMLLLRASDRKRCPGL